MCSRKKNRSLLTQLRDANRRCKSEARRADRAEEKAADYQAQMAAERDRGDRLTERNADLAEQLSGLRARERRADR